LGNIAKEGLTATLFIDAGRNGGSSEAPPTIYYQYAPSPEFYRKIASILARYLRFTHPFPYRHIVEYSQMKFIKLILITLLVLVISASYCSAQAQEADTSDFVPSILAGAIQSTYKNNLIYTESTNGAISGSVYSEKTGEFLGLLVERNSQDIPKSIWGGVYTSAEGSWVLKLNSEGLPAVLIDSSGLSFIFKNYNSNTVRITSYDTSNNNVIGRITIPLNEDKINEAKQLYDEANSTSYIGTVEKKLFDKKGLRALSTAWSIGACGVSLGAFNLSEGLATPLIDVSCRAGITKVVANFSDNELDDITNTSLSTGLCAISIAEANPLGVLDCASSVTNYILDNCDGNIDEGCSVNISHPTGLSLVGTHTDRLQIGWNPVSGADGYKVYRATSSNGTYSMVTTGGGTSYSDYDVTLGTNYYYKITAYNGNIESDYSNIITGHIINLSVPTGVSASSGTYSNSIKITWDLVSFSSGYKIYRATSLGGPYSLRYTGYPTTFYDYDVNPGATYYYKVTAYNGSSESAYSSYDAGYAGTLITSSVPTEVDATDGTDNKGCAEMTSSATIVSTDNLATTKFDTVSIDYSVSYSISNAQANSDGYTAKISGLLEIYSFNGHTWADVAAFDVGITNSSGTLTGSLTSHHYGEAFLAEKMRLHIQYACIDQTSASEAFSNELNISQNL